MSVSKRRALITGISGQDGYYLAKHLLDLGYGTVAGLIRGQNNPKRAQLERELPQVELIDGDLTDSASLVNAIYLFEPHEVYNLAAMSHVGTSFKQPELTANVTGLGPLRLLEAIKANHGSHLIRFYQASTSELFGKVRETPQTELTPFYPRSPYGTAKGFAHHTTVNYRESYNMHASCGILFNHESPRRGYEFVTRKITQAAARIKLGLQKDLLLGNLDSERDWGFAGDYVVAMHLMLQQDEPGDYVIATGVRHSIRELLKIAFGALDLEWENYVVQDPRYMRPAEVDILEGDATKARNVLGWTPKVSFENMIFDMVINDFLIEKECVRGTVPNYKVPYM